MRNQRRHPGFGYDLLKQVSMFVALVGVVLLLGYLARQFRAGHAPLASLIAGGACLILGLLFTMLSVICVKLSRIEHRLSDSEAPNNLAGQGKVEHDSAASQHTSTDQVANQQVETTSQ
jgi:hypothetical protein